MRVPGTVACLSAPKPPWNLVDSYLTFFQGGRESGWAKTGNYRRKNKMKLRKTTATLLIAIFMISTLSVILPSGATDSGNYAGSIIKAADRLVETQHLTSKGWAWKLPAGHTGPSTTFSSNLYGVTAIGLIDAYLLTGDSAYYDSAKLVADHITAVSPYQTGFYRGKEYFVGFDIDFLMKFAEVSADTAYSDYALSAWTYLKASGAKVSGTPMPFATAQNVYDAMLVRYSYLGHAMWHCSEYGLAANMLGDDTFVTEMANLLSPKLAQIVLGEGEFVGWGKALKFYSTIEGYQTEIAFLTQSLINAQNTDGSWDSGGPSGQDTANAMMGLVSAGVLGTLTDAADYLVVNQEDLGGWLITSDGKEIPQVGSEIIQALYAYALSVKLPRNIDPLYQPNNAQRMELVLTITGKTTTTAHIEGAFYFRGVDDGDVSWHAVLVVKSSDYSHAVPGDELLCHWKLLDEGYWGWIINAKGFNMHLYPTDERTQIGANTGERWRYTQPVEGKSYGAKVTGFLYQIGV